MLVKTSFVWWLTKGPLQLIFCRRVNMVLCNKPLFHTDGILPHTVCLSITPPHPLYYSPFYYFFLEYFSKAKIFSTEFVTKGVILPFKYPSCIEKLKFLAKKSRYQSKWIMKRCIMILVLWFISDDSFVMSLVCFYF